MALEDQVRTHEEWLRSIDSNLDRATAALARMTEREEARENRVAAVEDALSVVAQNQANFVASMAAAARRADEHDKRIEEHDKWLEQLDARIDRIAALVEQYLRSLTNGRN